MDSWDSHCNEHGIIKHLTFNVKIDTHKSYRRLILYYDDLQALDRPALEPFWSENADPGHPFPKLQHPQKRPPGPHSAGHTCSLKKLAPRVAYM